MESHLWCVPRLRVGFRFAIWRGKAAPSELSGTAKPSGGQRYELAEEKAGNFRARRPSHFERRRIVAGASRPRLFYRSSSRGFAGFAG